MEQPSVLTFEDSVLDFSEESRAELARQQDLLDLVKDERKDQWRGTILPLMLMTFTGVFIFLYPKALWSWFISGLVLYSWNFLFLLLPTTRKVVHNSGNVVRQKKSKEQRKLAYRRLLNKPKLTVEILITVFLGRMVPLTVGFTLILGTGMIVLFGFILTDYKAVAGLANLMIFQVVLIFIFYSLVNFLEPQTQGMTDIARSWKRRIGMAKLKGRAASFMVKAAAVGVLLILAIIFTAAMVLPSYTFLTLVTSLKEYHIWDVLLFIGIFIEQFWIMRTFQSMMSLRTANQALYNKIDRLQELMERANEISSRTEEDLARCDAMLQVTREYYALMLYDIYRTDLFGRLPVYLVGPRKKYIFDEKVLSHLP